MQLPAREAMDFDVVIVGAGPAGLATAIHLKQIAAAKGGDVSVVVVEKGSEVGAHSLSGILMDPVGLNNLLPGWHDDPAFPETNIVERDEFYVLGRSGGIRVPGFTMPKLLHNDGCYIASLGLVCKYLAEKAEALGVEIYPGFAASELLLDDTMRVVGIATGDMGIGRDGKPKSEFARGMELRARYTILAEGARGSLSKDAIRRFDLTRNADIQKHGLGIKELWHLKPEKHHPGLVRHTMGWPLPNSAGGGSFMYHYGDNLAAVGFVVHLNYSNPTLSPFDEFQTVKTHPLIREYLEGATRIGYGARAIAEGGWQSVPRLTFPGGCLVGDSAGFVNVPRVKGSHNAILSGMLCAEHLFEALAAGRAHDEVVSYEETWRSSAIGKDLYPVRNFKPFWAKLGTVPGLAFGGFDLFTHQLIGRSLFGTLKHNKPDHACFKPIDQVKPITYAKPDGVLTFDRASSVFLANLSHEEDQPCHLHLRDPSLPVASNLPRYGEPARFYCPAGVYEIVYGDEAAKTDPRFVINSQNCVHCKTCDIKDPEQNITWTTPEGGSGPNYSGL